jgi:hypothetical protein
MTPNINGGKDQDHSITLMSGVTDSSIKKIHVQRTHFGHHSYVITVMSV